MKKQILVTSILGLLLILCSCGSVTYSESEYNELKSNYDALLTDYNNLKTEYDELEEKYNDLVELNEQEQAEEEYVDEPSIEFEDVPENLSDYANDITYDQLARTPDDYLGRALQMKGEVVQRIEGDGEIQLRIAINGDYDDILFVAYDPSITEKRVLENDNVTVYGFYCGIYQYESTLGGIISVPSMYLLAIEIN